VLVFALDLSAWFVRSLVQHPRFLSLAFVPSALDSIPHAGRDFIPPVLTLPGSAADHYKEKTFFLCWSLVFIAGLLLCSVSSCAQLIKEAGLVLEPLDSRLKFC
jgi:hypothetical protein